MKKICLLSFVLFFLLSCSNNEIALNPSENKALSSASKAHIAMQDLSYEELSSEDRELLDHAKDAMSKSYSPYSHFHVGSALRSFDGEIITGSNVENAAYGPSKCAEQVALTRANMMGQAKIKTIAIIGKGEDFETEEVVAPYGGCRQVIYEFAQRSDTDIKIIMSNSRRDKIIVSTISELLPLAFGPKDLGINVE